MDEYRKKYYQEHKKEHNARSRAWAKNNPDSMKEIFSKYNNSPQYKEYLKTWKEENKEEIKIKARLSKRKQLQNPLERIKANLRNRIYKALFEGFKSKSTLTLLGCSIEEYKLYLQNKFTEGMSWENYGTVWEIDHIKPCATFDLSKIEDQHICFNYSNTQPLLISDNRSKGGKLLLENLAF